MSKRYRDAISGKYTNEESARLNPNTTVGEEIKLKSKKVKTSSTFTKDLLKVVEDLYILSESDYPLNIIDSHSLRVTSFSDFIDSQIFQQPENEKKFFQLKELMENNLTDLMVMIIGEEPLKQVLFLGKDNEGFYKGLISFIVET